MYIISPKYFCELYKDCVALRRFRKRLAIATGTKRKILVYDMIKCHILTKTIQCRIHNIVHFHHRFHFRAQKRRMSVECMKGKLGELRVEE